MSETESDSDAAEALGPEEVRALMQGLFFRPHLAALLRSAAEEELDLLILKGAALAETLYPRPGLRPFGDLDVLIRPEDAPRARRLLESLGYAVAAPAWEALLEGRDSQANFFKGAPRGAVVIELHTDLINNAFFRGHVRLDAAGLWARARPARLAGADARVLGPEDQLLHLCLHLAGHYLAAPKSLQDIDLLCRREPVSWPLFARLTGESGAAPACFAALSAAAAVLGTPIPNEVLGGLAPARGAARLTFLAAARASDPAGTERLRFPLLWGLLGTARARLSALRRLLLPGHDWLVAHYYHDLFDDPDGPRPGGPIRDARIWGVLYASHLAFLLRRLAGEGRP